MLDDLGFSQIFFTSQRTTQIDPPQHELLPQTPAQTRAWQHIRPNCGRSQVFSSNFDVSQVAGTAILNSYTGMLSCDTNGIHILAAKQVFSSSTPALSNNNGSDNNFRIALQCCARHPCLRVKSFYFVLKLFQNR